jgi:hypothetical protein
MVAVNCRYQAITVIDLEPVPHSRNRKAALRGYVRLMGESGLPYSVLPSSI